MSTPEDHRVLDSIINWALYWFGVSDIRRESECIEFFDERQGRFFEIVVRPIDADPEDWERVGCDMPEQLP